MFAEPELAPFAQAELREPGLANARSDIGRELAALLDGCRLPVACPGEVAVSARLAVEHDFPLWAALQSYRTGHAVQFEAWLEAVDALELGEEQRRELVETGSRFFFEYADRCCRWIEREYTRERDDRLRGAERRRRQAIGDLLEGRAPDAGSLEVDLDAEHLGVIARGQGGERALEDLAWALGRSLLCLAAGREEWWGWLTATEPARLSDVCGLGPRLRLPADVRLALGVPARGVEGFRRTHREAVRIDRVAARGEVVQLADYDALALEAIATEDEAAARTFVLHELGSLGGEDPRSRTFRETLVVYLESGQQAASAAARLGVHERTVANRLRAIEQRIGRPVASRHAELATALRLRGALGARAPGTSPSN